MRRSTRLSVGSSRPSANVSSPPVHLGDRDRERRRRLISRHDYDHQSVQDSSSDDAYTEDFFLQSDDAFPHQPHQRRRVFMPPSGSDSSSAQSSGWDVTLHEYLHPNGSGPSSPTSQYHPLPYQSFAEPNIAPASPLSDSSMPDTPPAIPVLNTADRPVYDDFGDLTEICPKCHALYWYEERCRSASRVGEPVYNLCCRGGRVSLPPIDPTPSPLSELLDPLNGPDSRHFLQSIRMYNSMFAFTSMGVEVDETVNFSRGPYVFRVSGQLCHLIGSLLPDDDSPPRFAQLYMYDTENEIANRLNHFSADRSSVPRLHIVQALKDMLDQYNPYVQGFRSVRNRIVADSGDALRLRIASHRSGDGRQYSAPTSSEVVGLIVGDIDAQHVDRDIIVQRHSGRLQRISSLHPSYMPFQYPLIYLRGEDSFRLHIQCNVSDSASSSTSREHVTMNEYYCYRLHVRAIGSNIILRSGHLLQQLSVDMFACVDQSRLWYVHENQSSLRSDTFQNVRDAVINYDLLGHTVGRRIVLPPSYVGSPRYMFQNYQDAIAVCRHLGPPHLFITFTLIYMVEFQKRGLPHVHIVLWLAEQNSLSDARTIDRVISAELPEPSLDPDGYSVVSQFMVHGPCGASRPHSPCMQDGNCTKRFPKRFHDTTLMTEDGTVVYRRRDTGVTVHKNGVTLDNRYVVPHNLNLLCKYQAHINVERCHTSMMIKYLFKYICKGRDRARVSIHRDPNNASQNNIDQPQQEQVIDEVLNYLDCRYLTPHESVWRLFQYDIHYSHPTVERLPIHLPFQNNIVFRDSQSLQQVASNPANQQTKLTAWFQLNQNDPFARTLTYPEVTKYYTWHKDEKNWQYRQQGHRLARMHFIHLGAGDVYYVRTLLNCIRGALSFDDLRTVNDTIRPTFKDACSALGMLDDNTEWLSTMQEAAATASSYQIRQIFIDILLYSEVADALDLWNSCWNYMGDDIVQRIRDDNYNPEMILDPEIVKDRILYELEDILFMRGYSLQYVRLPAPSRPRTNHLQNRLLAEQYSFNTVELQMQVPNLVAGLNFEQKNIFDAVVQSVISRIGKLYFVYGHGGTGKTFLWRALTAYLRAKGKIVLTVASSGLSSLLLEGGVTAYYRFKIPLKLKEGATCDIKKHTHLAYLLLQTSLIVWDEAPMNNKICFEALDRSMRDIFSDWYPLTRDKPFAGVTVVLGGDFRQTLPVISHGTRFDTVSASITNSYLWPSCNLMKLTINMRLLASNQLSSDSQHLSAFAAWLLSIGNGETDAAQLYNSIEPDWIHIPDQFLVPHNHNPQQAIIDAVYPNFSCNYQDENYLQRRAVITPKNNAANELNEGVLRYVPGQQHDYYSFDSAQGYDDLPEDLQAMFTPDMLNTITSGSLPCHKLSLKIGVPVMLLRNMDQANGLCNGTRMIITALGTRVIDARIITGPGKGKIIIMARLIPVSTLTETTRTQDAKIHGRPVRIWPASDPRRGRVWKFNFLFLDHMGGKIQGIVMTPDYQRVANSFAEQNIVEITRFTVAAGTKDYQVVDYDYVLKITQQTQINTLPSDMYPIPIYHFDFKPLEDVGTKITYEKAVLDVIARLSGFSTIRTVPTLGNARVQTMYLTNERGYTMDVALWADFIDKFNMPELYEQSKTAPIIIACNGLQIKKGFGDIYSLKTYTGTRFHFDTNIKEISDYLQQTPYDNQPIVLEATPEMFNRDAPAHSLLTKSPPVRITLAQLNGLYRIRVQVRDQTDAAQFMLLGKTGEMIVGVDAVTLKMRQDENDGRVPQALQDIVNKAYLFTVQGKQPGPLLTYRTYTVSRHEQIPNEMLDLLPEPILLIEDSSSAQPSTAGPTANTPPPPQDKGKGIVPDLAPITPHQKSVSLKRSPPQQSADATVPAKTLKRSLEQDLSASSHEEMPVPPDNPSESLPNEAVGESTNEG
ncbi:hypothetical protein LUZ63_010753 [Rhynchospora breviuscula]|uniref:ATP-dependent DNA helicase n=1 Tax=Rhynchospora breviuscula TaxID=2022672 RepID=A0A9Q0C430_9POAL|nr:hypothetical protein LUZ63_018215 [Rhynchospora breviuscula]KAJ1694055.1 hypothetical protein LUZ63_010753 [Rhynchospora breviuscula]